MIGSGTFRLEPPRLRTNEDQASDRHATWYELFFDLVFAAAVVELSTSLADDPTSAVFGRFAGLFVAITLRPASVPSPVSASAGGFQPGTSAPRGSALTR